MELESEPEKEYNPCSILNCINNYIKETDTSTEICMVCLCDETEDNKDNIWTRYELKCGHQMHSRCARQWFCKKKGVYCSLCGCMEKEDNNYCKTCNEWGHSCNKIKNYLYNSYPWYNQDDYSKEERLKLFKTLRNDLKQCNDPKNAVLQFVKEIKE